MTRLQFFTLSKLWSLFFYSAPGFLFSPAILSVLGPATGDEGDNGNDSSWSMECSTVIRVQTLHISSPILAAKSPFFYKVYMDV